MTRYPFAPLADIAVARWRANTEQHEQATVTGRVADIVGVAPMTALRWERGGLNERAADQAAVALGLHPGEIWPEWFDEGAA